MGDACYNSEFVIIMYWVYPFLRSFNFRAYPNCWFSLCMAKRSVGMVLAPEYSDNKEEKNDIETVMNSIEFPVLDQTTQNSVISTTSNDLSNWSRLSSLWTLLYGTDCCFIEFASLIARASTLIIMAWYQDRVLGKRNLILTGTVTMKMAPSLVRLYEQMPEPKYVIAMGACTITGGMFSTDSYSTIRGVDKLIVDVYLPGFPPKPEEVIDAITKLRKKVSREIYQDRFGSQQIIDGRLSAWLVKHGLVHRFLGFDYQGFETLQIKPEDWHSIAVIHMYMIGFPKVIQVHIEGQTRGKNTKFKS
ncbi:hypothetical protein C5167_025380 [Papaver somniferum]|uniref:NADH:ubiquinone oxidoreductase-like 20kDa subunit domain-containing protein n=1 Tax=Papaver somniferum TaxID=3469 RepID=A0A4Y7JV00_PAPSO|nr:hypothetical protein C5167_025380 [Papaver somniferum]